MATQNGRRMIRRGFLFFTVIVSLLFSMSGLAGGNLVRAEFQVYGQLPGVYADSFAPIDCGEYVNNELVDFNYVDDQDSTCGNRAAADQVNSDVSGGGRWHFHSSIGQAGPRTLTFDFSMPENGANCARLKEHMGANGLGLGCDCETACNAQVWIAADRLFKKGAERQALGRFDIVVPGFSGPQLRMDYVNPLYICEDPDHPGKRDWRVLTSLPDSNCEPNGVQNDSVVEVVIPPVGGTGLDEVLGRWYLPFDVRAQKVALPADGGGDDPPPNCPNPDGTLAKGESCSSDSECCSGSCKGGRRGKTCK